MTYYFKQFIGGVWTSASDHKTWDLVNPATEEVIQQVPFGDIRDAHQAIDAAEKALPSWSGMTSYERGDILLRATDWINLHIDDLARFTTEESGKPLSESAAEWRSATNYIKWFAEEAKRAYGRIIPSRTVNRRIHVIHQPIGVVATITAWNFPVYNIIRSWAAALAAGCTVVGRPSEYTPRSAFLLAQAFDEAGIPNGVLNVVNGDPVSIGRAFLEDTRVRKIAFTGSTRVGKLLMEGSSKTVTRLALELGGNAPVLVFPDADIKKVVQNSVTWKFRNCGQVCVSPQRFFVHTQIAEEFIDTATSLTKALVMGDGLDAKTDVGPLINARQRDRVANLVEKTMKAGAQTLIGGEIPSRKGYFYQPTIITDVREDMPIYHEEMFGPVMPIIPFDDTEQALAMANNTEYGLAAFVMTQDLNTAMLMSERLEYGMVCVNDWLPATPEAPFGGIKQSGIGRETGSEGLLEYMETKTVFFGNVD